MKFEVGDQIVPTESFYRLVIEKKISLDWHNPPKKLVVSKILRQMSDGPIDYVFAGYPTTISDFIDEYFEFACFCKQSLEDHSECKKKPVSSLGSSIKLKVL